MNAMAVAAKKSIPVSDLKDILKRALCREDREHARMLLCTSCLEVMTLSITKGQQKKLTCPKCPQSINLPPGPVTNLQLDSTLQEIYKLIYDPSRNLWGTPSSAQSQKCLACCAVCLDVEISFYCTTCNDYLCSTCNAEHKQTKVFANHKVLHMVGTKAIRKISCEIH